MSIKLNNLQSLRGLAVLLVIWHHSTFLLGTASRNSIIGFTGVPLFFIISGFIMVYTTRSMSEDVLYNIKEFAIKRLIRILPLFYFAILLWIIICRKDFIINPQFDKIFKTAFFIPHFTDQLGPFYGFWILGVNWSLNYEMFFYLLFATSFIFSSKRYYFLFMVFFILLVGLPLLINGSVSLDMGKYVPYDFEYLNLMSNPILWYFVVGVSIGLIIDKIILYVNNKSMIYAFYVAAIILFILYISKVIPTHFGFEIVVCSMLLIGALLADMGNHINFQVPKFMIFLGNISYSIYLMHAIIFMYIPLIARKYGIDHLVQSWYTFFAVLMIVFSISSVTYYIIEKRFTNYLRNKLL